MKHTERSKKNKCSNKRCMEQGNIRKVKQYTAANKHISEASKEIKRKKKKWKKVESKWTTVHDLNTSHWLFVILWIVSSVECMFDNLCWYISSCLIHSHSQRPYFISSMHFDYRARKAVECCFLFLSHTPNEFLLLLLLTSIILFFFFFDLACVWIEYSMFAV